MTETIDQTALKIQNDHLLCNDCLGRLCRTKETRDLSEKQRGRQYRSDRFKDKSITHKECCFCQGVLDEISHFVEVIKEDLKLYEFSTFLIGCKLPDDIIDKEKEIIKTYNLEDVDPLKMQINREIGAALEKEWKKEVSFDDPDIVIVIDTSFDVLHLQIRSVYFYGRYNKFSRSIPQTHWSCRICQGIGCRECNYRGKLYTTSVEELTASPLLEVTKGQSESFHGCGREDVDARMLGSGRPFVVEIKNPMIRSIDCNKAEKRINEKGKDKIKINSLKKTTKEDIERLKKATFNKKYEVLIEGKSEFDDKKLKSACKLLTGVTLDQSTPSRVAHRRADKIRRRKIYKCDVAWLEGNRARLQLETESGTYVKELISGDNGRTRPNLSKLIGNPSYVLELDVLEIMGE